jgi:hypothetical protein
MTMTTFSQQMLYLHKRVSFAWKTFPKMPKMYGDWGMLETWEVLNSLIVVGCNQWGVFFFFLKKFNEKCLN